MPRKKSIAKTVKVGEIGSMSWDLGFDIEFKFKSNDKHKSFIGTTIRPDTKMVFVDGPAGTAKTYLATYCAASLLKKHVVENIIYIRSVVESASQKMGSLPGEVDDKFAPWSMPMVEKLDELVGIPARKELIERSFVSCVPVNFVRGLTFNDSVVIVDEAQNLTQGELITILTRFGANSKFIIVGDTRQSDIGNRSGFGPVMRCFNNVESEDQDIFTFEFGEDEIVRSEILKFIVKQLDNVGK